MSAPTVVAALGRHRTSAIVRAGDAETAALAMRAALAGGVRIVEFTLTTPGALELVTEFAREELAEIDGLARPIVGAGTVLRPVEVERAALAGARFVVSPVFDAAVVQAAVAADLAVLPGVHTPTEMLAAWRAGAQLLKLFPAPALGPAWLRSVLAPLPWLKVIPTNGVDLDNAAAWLDAGAFAIGLVGDVFRPDWLHARDVAAIEARVRAIRDVVEHAPRRKAVADPARW
jgi:2-dehydro-3-deoxyphosphogluconate aldolase/(4S)-4-hydroxy-2-oxoglutarate aldolase